jgi:hypothetical protein
MVVFSKDDAIGLANSQFAVFRGFEAVSGKFFPRITRKMANARNFHAPCVRNARFLGWTFAPEPR